MRLEAVGKIDRQAKSILHGVRGGQGWPMRKIWGIALCTVLWANCAPALQDKVDLKKARTGFALANGDPISSDVYDDYSPQLVRKPDGKLILIFGSNRTCAGCTGGQNYMFLSESLTTYTGDDLPRFAPPIPIKLGSPHPISARSSIKATWRENSLQIFARTAAGNITGYQINSGNLGTATTNTPEAGTNTTRLTNTFLDVNLKTIYQLTQQSGIAYVSSFLFPDPGVEVENYILDAATSAVEVPQHESGTADSLYIVNDGRLYFGTFDLDLGEDEFVNAALEDSSLYLTKIGIMPYFGSIPGTLVFSAGASNAAQQDLYVITSHDVFTLWLLSGQSDFDFTNPEPYQVFATAATTQGNFGGVIGADNLCNNDTRSPDIHVTYKAMITTDTRIATTTGFDDSDQEDWVFQPDSMYMRSGDLNPLGFTDQYGLMDLMFIDPLGFDGQAGNAWTGFDTTGDFTTGANTCSNWTSTGGNGLYGNVNTFNAAAIGNTAVACTNNYKIVCVEQP